MRWWESRFKNLMLLRKLTECSVLRNLNGLRNKKATERKFCLWEVLQITMLPRDQTDQIFQVLIVEPFIETILNLMAWVPTNQSTLLVFKIIKFYIPPPLYLTPKIAKRTHPSIAQNLNVPIVPITMNQSFNLHLQIRTWPYRLLPMKIPKLPQD